MWKAYDKIEDIPGKEYTLKTLCHDVEFVASDGTHTQTIEGTWATAKRDIPIQCCTGEDLQECLFEFSWRRQNEKDLWKGLMRGLSTVCYTQSELKDVLEARHIRGSEAIDATDDDFLALDASSSDCSLSANSYDSGSTGDNSTAALIDRDNAIAMGHMATYTAGFSVATSPLVGKSHGKLPVERSVEKHTP